MPGGCTADIVAIAGRNMLLEVQYCEKLWCRLVPTRCAAGQHARISGRPEDEERSIDKNRASIWYFARSILKTDR